ncbi:MAG: N-acetylmuramoyl-L-alanine amidase, partial [Oscillospiraceae bacterium]|nr:N-acetylmuramoyl-L-alanine amidase [Oscillospiraceae bacterium]
LKICNSSENNIYISIHQNKFQQSSCKGTQVFYSPNNDISKAFAEAVQSTVKNLLQNDNDRKIKPSNGSIYILDNSEVPCILVECGFISNPDEAYLLSTEEYQKQISFALYLGFLDFYNNFY